MIKGALVLTPVAALALGLAGCSKNEPVTPAAGDVSNTAGSIAVAATNVVAEVTNTAAAMSTAAAMNATAATNAVDNSKIQGLIDKAKSLVAETNLTDASSVLQQLTGQSLTDEQQKLVDSLKDQIQQAIAAKAAGGAAGSVGNLLNR
jgi:hypothetical protein